ncbi:iron chaperone [Lapillicoccus sp.]|uniref:iron chaperone n=1 Tax=Lapillicoccus sp. TaxID=1909287 RepID=UPI003983B0ED
MAVPVATIDTYIASFPQEVQVVLETVRQAILTAVPGDREAISHAMPAITLDGSAVVNFAAWKGHLSLYPLPHVEGALAKEVAAYRTAKHTGRFPLSGPVPYDLIGRLAALLGEQRTLAGG